LDEGALPATMRALVVESYGGPLRLIERPVPRPAEGQVLVRISAAPINPSDIAFIKGLYGIRKPLPTVPGFEGSGVVVAAGGGLLPRLQVGRRVACSSLPTEAGTWAEYMLASGAGCVPLRRMVSLEEGATLLANPLSAWLLLDMARRGGHRAAVSTAAASMLGRMLLRLGLRFNYPIIHVVRRQEQVDLLRALGGTHVLNSSDSDFEEQLRTTCRQLGATIAFDAVSGKMTAQLVMAMPRGGHVVVYGGLSFETISLSPGAFVFHNGTVSGFWISQYTRRLGRLRMLKTLYRLQTMLGDDLRTEIRQRLPPEQVPQALDSIQQGASLGKTLIVMRPNDG
ncbi:MAG: zinc-binding dehydrogenase, partial [Gemmatimonadaceae bacterium]